MKDTYTVIYLASNPATGLIYVLSVYTTADLK